MSDFWTQVYYLSMMSLLSSYYDTEQHSSNGYSEKIGFAEINNSTDYSIKHRRIEIEKKLYPESNNSKVKLDCSESIPISISYFYCLGEFYINKSTCTLSGPGPNTSVFKLNARSYNQSYLIGHDKFTIKAQPVNDIDPSWKKVGNNIVVNISVSELQNSHPKYIIIPGKRRIKIPLKTKDPYFTIFGLGFPISRIDRGDIIFHYINDTKR